MKEVVSAIAAGLFGGLSILAAVVWSITDAAAAECTTLCQRGHTLTTVHDMSLIGAIVLAVLFVVACVIAERAYRRP